MLPMLFDVAIKDAEQGLGRVPAAETRIVYTNNDRIYDLNVPIYDLPRSYMRAAPLIAYTINFVFCLPSVPI